MEYLLSTADCRLLLATVAVAKVADCRLMLADCRLAIAYCLLPLAGC